MFALRGRFLAAALAPLLLLAGLAFVLGRSDWADQVSLALFGVLWHRVVLLDQRPSVWSSLSWSRAHFVFLGFGVASFAVTELIDRATDAATGTAVLVACAAAGPVIFYVESRLSPLLPAVAIGRSASPVEAWRLSRGNGVRLILAGVLATFVPVMVALAVTFYVALAPPAFGAPNETALGIAARLSGFLWYFVVVAFGVTALSLSFKQLSDNAREPAPAD